MESSSSGLKRLQSELISQVVSFLDVPGVVSLDEAMSSCNCDSGGCCANLENAYKQTHLEVFDVYPFSASNGFAGAKWAMKREVLGFCPRNLVIPRVDYSLQLQYLLAHDMYDIAELIIRKSNERDFNIRPNESCMTILHYCAWKGLTHLVSLLLSKSTVDTSACYGTNKRTPYVTALQHGHTDIVDLLQGNRHAKSI